MFFIINITKLDKKSTIYRMFKNKAGTVTSSGDKKEKLKN